MVESSVAKVEQITEKTDYIRGVKIMLDRNLASLYGVETKYLKQAVRRGHQLFPR